MTSDHCCVTQNFPICLTRWKKLFDSRPAVVWPPTTVPWPFNDFWKNYSDYFAWNVERKLFDSRPTVACPPTTVAWPFSDFFSKFHRIAWQVEITFFDSHSTFAWPPTTVAWPFSNFFQKCGYFGWIVEKKLFDSRPTVTRHPTTVAWRFSNFYQHFSELLETSEKNCWTSADGRVAFRHLPRDRSATFFKTFTKCLKRRKKLF